MKLLIFADPSSSIYAASSLCLHFLLYMVIIISCLASPGKPSLISDIVCNFVKCGEGKCVQSNTLLGFDCDCNTGWKQFQIGSLVLPPCILPNCTIELGCGSSSPSPSPSPPPSIDLSNPCSYTVCGDGTCLKVNKSDFTCECNEGASHLLNSSESLCLKDCSFGDDCKLLGFGGHTIPSQTPWPLPSSSSQSTLPPSPNASNSADTPKTSGGNVSPQKQSNSKNLKGLTALLFNVMFIYFLIIII